MKIDRTKLAPYGLYLALLAALVAGGLYIVRREVDLALQIALGVVVLGLALYALLDPRRLRQNLTGRQARYGSNALILTIALTGILVVSNILVAQNSPRIDLTADKTNTLSVETLDILAGLKQPVKAEAYFSSRYPSSGPRQLLENFKREGKGSFDFEIIDLEADPIRAQRAGVTADGTIVFTQQDRAEKLSYADESEIVNALVRLDNPGQRAVYFLSGHGEYAVDGSGERAYTSVKQTLEKKSYTVKALNLLAERAVPSDASALIVAGPDNLISPEETIIIQEYLDRGGAVVLLSEPPLVTQAGDQPDPLAPYLETAWGVRLGNDLVIDANYDPPIVAVAASYARHPITDKMGNQVVILPTTRSIQAVQAQNTDVTSTSLVQTAQNTWAETSKDELNSNNVSFQENTDLAGPISIAIAAENSATEARLVVVGDSDFGGDSSFGQYGNGTFLINAIDWAAGQDNLINLTPRQNTQRILILRDPLLINLLLLGVIIIMPGVVLLSGILVWINRRRRG
jgi:ABC-type uncharacterized transport system involved in gliding motility auxiliary subunit